MRLTERGRDLIDDAVAAGAARQQELLAVLPARKQEQLTALLREMLAPLEDPPEQTRSEGAAT